MPGALNLNNASLLEVINLLAQDLHINYILDASIKGGSVTINTYGAVRDVDLRPLLETILRMNNLAMVQVGNIYRIIPAANIARQPVSPITQTDPSKISGRRTAGAESCFPALRLFRRDGQRFCCLSSETAAS